MGGSKGQSTQQTAQSQTYTPNQQAYGYLTDALSRAQQTANLPFNVPQAPVAGFSQDQQDAFQGVRNAQGMAQPYINQAANYFSPQGAQQFYNPMADSVTAQMKNIFGQQQAQTTGQLTQAAGGVGADRIAVGQANLANQQGLAAGQTYANLYGQAVQQAQGAGYGTAALGSQAQNAALQGAQAQLGTGSLQQQLQQAQLNAPYQQQVAQAQFPYQQTQWYGNLVGGLAGGLGGTTQGTGNTTSTPAQPSIWSQILGGGLAAAGGLGQSGAFGSNGWMTGSSPSYGGGNAFSGDAYGGSSANPLPGLTASDYGEGFAEGGDVSDQPIDIAAQPFISPGQMKPMQQHVPQLNLNPPQQSGGGGGGSGGAGDIVSAGLKIAGMFLNRGGAVDSDAMKSFDGHDPYTFFQSRFPKGYAEGGSPDDSINPDEPFRMPDEGSVAAWRQGVDADRAAGRTAPDVIPAATPDATIPLPEIITGKKRSGASHAMAFSPEGNTAPMQAASTAAPAAAVSAPAPGHSHDRSGFIDSPWAALTAAGLGIMGGTSPFAGVNIGQGGMQGLKMLEQQRENVRKDETVEQAAHRLEQEAKFHEDQYSRLTMGQKQAAEQADRPYEELTAEQKAADQRQRQQMEFNQKQANRPYEELTAEQKVQLEQSRQQHDQAIVGQGFKPKYDENGHMISAEPVTGGMHDPAQIKAEADAKRMPAMNREDMSPLVDAYMAGDHSVMNGIGRGAQGPQNIQQFWNMTAERLRSQGADGKTIAAAKADFMAQTAALRVSAQREANVTTAVNEANGTFPEVLRTSALLPRGEFVPFNEALQYARTKTGSEAQRSYGAAIQAAVTAYSQAMSRTGANSVYAQQHAADIMSKADGPKAIAASIRQLKIEMEIAKNAPAETRQDILNHILGVTPQQQEAASAATQPSGTAAGPPAVPRPANVPEGSQYSPSRKMWRTPDNKMFDASGNPVQ